MIGRRTFIKALALAGALPVFPGKVFAAPPPERALSLFNVHTGESLRTIYCAEGIYDTAALQDIYRLLRCHYTGEIVPISSDVIDLLCDITNAAGWKGEVAIISGYRSPKYNEHLFSIGRKVSRDSLHLQGRAIDFSLEGISARKLSSVARSFVAGGVGTYADFVHIDDGRVRYW